MRFDCSLVQFKSIAEQRNYVVTFLFCLVPVNVKTECIRRKLSWLRGDKLKTVRWLSDSKPDNLNSTGGTHMVEKENQLPQTVLENAFTPPRKKNYQKK